MLGLDGIQIKHVLGGKIKLVTSIRGYDATKILHRDPHIYDELFGVGDLFLPVSHSLKNRIVEHGCPEEKIVVLPSGIDCEQLQHSTENKPERQPVTVLTVARLVEKKGIAFAIEAVARVLESGRSLRYVIVGEGVLHDGLEQLIENLDLQKHVQLLGRKNHEEVIRLLHEAHILIVPSITTPDGDQEGIPNVLKEAMVSGLPVISTFHGGIPELVEDGVSGFLVEERDVDSLAKRVMSLVDDPEARRKMGEAGRAHVQEVYDINKLNDQLVNLYEQVRGKDNAA